MHQYGGKTTRTHVSWRPFALLALLSAATFLGFMRAEIVAEWNVSQLYWISVAVAVGTLAVIGAAGRLTLWSSAFFYAVVLAAFHLGVPIVYALGGNLPFRASAYTATWFKNNAATRDALWLCLMAMVMFALGYLLTASRPSKNPRPAGDTGARLLGPVGLAFNAAGALMFMGYAAVAAPALFLSGTKRMFEATIAGSGPVAMGILLTSIGAVITAAAPKSQARTASFAVFGVFALFTLAIGSRTAALYSAVAIVVVLARLRPMPRKRVAIATVVGGLMLVNGVQQVRSTGVSLATLREFIGSPVAALNEMGWSLRPVIETVSKLHSGATEMRFGETYFVGVIRAVEPVLGLDRPYPDLRWAGTVVSYGRTDGLQIGYSTIAEAFLNFGALGVVVGFLTLGLAFGRWDNNRLGDRISAARVGVLFVSVLSVVRQGSNTMLTMLIIGLVAIEVTRWLAGREPRPKRNRVVPLNKRDFQDA